MNPLNTDKTTSTKRNIVCVYGRLRTCLVSYAPIFPKRMRDSRKTSKISVDDNAMICLWIHLNDISFNIQGKILNARVPSRITNSAKSPFGEIRCLALVDNKQVFIVSTIYTSHNIYVYIYPYESTCPCPGYRLVCTRSHNFVTRRKTRGIPTYHLSVKSRFTGILNLIRITHACSLLQQMFNDDLSLELPILFLSLPFTKYTRATIHCRLKLFHAMCEFMCFCMDLRYCQCCQ